MSKEQRKKRVKYRQRQQHCEEKLKEDESLTMFLSAIATLIEDAPQITLLLYMILCCREQDTLGQFQLTVVSVVLIAH